MTWCPFPKLVKHVVSEFADVTLSFDGSNLSLITIPKSGRELVLDLIHSHFVCGTLVYTIYQQPASGKCTKISFIISCFLVSFNFINCRGLVFALRAVIASCPWASTAYVGKMTVGISFRA